MPLSRWRRAGEWWPRRDSKQVKRRQAIRATSTRLSAPGRVRQLMALMYCLIANPSPPVLASSKPPCSAPSATAACQIAPSLRLACRTCWDQKGKEKRPRSWGAVCEWKKLKECRSDGVPGRVARTWESAEGWVIVERRGGDE